MGEHDGSRARFAYLACGTTVSSDRELPGMRVLTDAPVHGFDLLLDTGEQRPVPRDVPPGEPVVDPGDTHREFFGASRDDAGYLFRFFERFEVRFDAKLSRGVCHRDPGADHGLTDVLLSGTVMAFVLAMRGTCILHATAVEYGGRALGFVGHSGMGKSTVALAACSAGARLIAEDVLAVVVDDGRPVVLPGNNEIRLRQGSASLASGFVPESRGQTPDGRISVHPPAVADDALVPLAALLVPRPARRLDKPVVRRLEPVSGVFRLMNYPRVNGLRDPAAVRAQFTTVADIARQVPISDFAVPWGPPFPPDLGEQILAQLPPD